MNLSSLTFVALDLETTGLSPEKDTIIEVAAVKFHLTREGDIWRAVDQEERSMLIDPGRPLEEQIAMITGISDTMLVGKPRWEDVRARVETFIGDAIIVGHNVLFDVAMFRTHGIDLSRHVNLDTFELSEIFSRDAESLNLGFLGKKYKIDMESEHRALDDTKLSIALFTHYLSDITQLSGRYLDLWHHASVRDESKMISTLLEITGHEKKEVVFQLDFDKPDLSEVLKSRIPHSQLETLNSKLISLSGDREEELSLIKKYLSAHTPLLILTSNKKQSLYLEGVLREEGHTVGIF